ncbi:FAD-binding oxidoreductase [Pseudovibrio sp. SPO723]|uniref:NAD(P)/FAD-dependent oxidoreductase n=1 Tax=Nesiotobacter zosterae TaxID=392721 RepID=UPI0029C20316|nr:FAD-binding oxidoreductase [Pseudovibrio sp. SPO723]MDX5595053.1 FAD-binding oxidoreductase [Pseudovibrio sp. SPO723]
MGTKRVDVAIIGGAVMGSSVAFHLAAHSGFSGSIAVIEKDPSYQKCASALSAASIRHQFSAPINIQISQMGIDFLRNIGDILEVDGERPRIDLNEGGYLFLATPEKREILERNHKTQIELEADIAFLERDALSEKFPWLNTTDLSAGCHGLSGEGWFDGYGLMQAFRRKARALGVDYMSDTVSGLRPKAANWQLTLNSGSTIEAGVVVNTAGASGGAAICSMVGLDLPIHCRKRIIFTFDCREKVPNLPLLIDPTGAYVRPEGNRFICGSAPLEDPDCEDFEVDHSFFEEFLWPTLAHRIPAFGAIKPGPSWAGHYDMNLFDHNAFVGPVSGLDNFHLALGFSGHGLQQSPAVGRGIAEQIIFRGYRTLDLSPLGLDRFYQNRPLHEVNVV